MVYQAGPANYQDHIIDHHKEVACVPFPHALFIVLPTWDHDGWLRISSYVLILIFILVPQTVWPHWGVLTVTVKGAVFNRGGLWVRHFSCKFPRQTGSCDLSMCVWAAQAHLCALQCALICMLSHPCFHMCALLWVLSYVLSYVCSHMCAFFWVLSSVCSHMCALICVLLYVCLHMSALICVLLYVCLHMCALICLPLCALICVSSLSWASPPLVSYPVVPPRCLGSLAGIMMFFFIIQYVVYSGNDLGHLLLISIKWRFSALLSWAIEKDHDWLVIMGVSLW